MFQSLLARPRFAGSPTGLDARVGLLDGLARAVRLRSEGCGVAKSPSYDGPQDGAEVGNGGNNGRHFEDGAADKALDSAETTAKELITDMSKGPQRLNDGQVRCELYSLKGFATTTYGTEICSCKYMV